MSHPFLAHSGLSVSSPFVQSLMQPGERVLAEWHTRRPDSDVVEVVSYSAHDADCSVVDAYTTAGTLAEASIACHDALQDYFEHTLEEQYGLTAEEYVPALSRALQTVRTRTATPATEAWGLTDPRWYDTGQLALKLAAQCQWKGIPVQDTSIQPTATPVEEPCTWAGLRTRTTQEGDEIKLCSDHAMEHDDAADVAAAEEIAAGLKPLDGSGHVRHDFSVAHTSHGMTFRKCSGCPATDVRPAK